MILDKALDTGMVPDTDMVPGTDMALGTAMVPHRGWYRIQI